MINNLFLMEFIIIASCFLRNNGTIIHKSNETPTSNKLVFS